MTLSIETTYSVGHKTFKTQAEAEAYLLMEQRKAAALQLLNEVRKDHPTSHYSVRNSDVIDLIANHFETFEEVLQTLKGGVQD